MLMVTTSGKSFAQIKNEMISTDSLNKPWELFIDSISMNVRDVIMLFVLENISGGLDPHADYKNLEKITVDSHVSEYASIDECLVYIYRGQNYLIYAPENMRTCIGFTGYPQIAGVSKVFPYNSTLLIDNDIWNGLYSKAIRTNISRFNWSNKSYFEELLMRYKDNIYELFRRNLGMIWKDTRTDYIPRVIPFVNEIKLSEELRLRLYRPGSGYGSDIVYGDDREEIGVEIFTNPDEFDKKVKDPKDGCVGTEVWDPLLGAYYSKEHKIVLYVNAIKRYAGEKGLVIENLFLSVFIHEFFHGVHHTFCENYHPGKTSPIPSPDPFIGKKNAIIKESLADAFEYYFCKHVLHDTDLMSNMEATWNSNGVNVYPYSGALNVRRSGMSKRDIYARIHASCMGCLDKMTGNLNMLDPDGLNILYYFLWSIESMDDAQSDMLTR